MTATTPMALARDRLGVPSVLFFVMSAAAPLTVAAGVVTTGYAVTGLVGIPVAFVVVGAVLALFSVGFVTMASRVTNAGAFYAYLGRGLAPPIGVAGAWVAPGPGWRWPRTTLCRSGSTARSASRRPPCSAGSACSCRGGSSPSSPGRSWRSWASIPASWAEDCDS